MPESGKGLLEIAFKPVYISHRDDDESN